MNKFKVAKVKPTNNCQSRCITCNYWKEKFENELNFDKWIEVLDQIKASGVSESISIWPIFFPSKKRGTTNSERTVALQAI